MSTRDQAVWPHRWAILLCCMTFPLLWVGQLITTTDAGMAVPDWPGTYGYNMFLYPAETWLFGPWDLFIEHGHRLLASVVGMVTIAFLVVVWRESSLRWLRGLAVASLGLVVFQGMLGGGRVLANERLVGMLHGSTGPLFFALTCVLVVLTARVEQSSANDQHGHLCKLAIFSATLAFVQLMLGASLRHIDAGVGPWSFASLVKFHLAMAVAVCLHVLWLAWRSWKSAGTVRWVGVLASALVLAQLGLGLAAWLAKYGAPRWAIDWLPTTIDPITAGGWSQTHTVTAHSAIGSLLLGLLAAMATLAWCRDTIQEPPQSPSSA